MKRLLTILIATLLVITAFVACSKDETRPDPNRPMETTTINVSKIEISEGIKKGENYSNKSLGFKIFCPEGYKSQTFGALNLTPENINDIPTYEYYLTLNNDEKILSITIDKNDNIKSVDDWKKTVKYSSENNPTNIGYRHYISVTETDKDGKTTIDFVTYGNDKTCKLSFFNFTYEEAIKFIQDNFETL